MEEHKIQVTQTFLLVLKIFLEQEASEKPESLHHTEWYDFLRHMPSVKNKYWISTYCEDSSSPVAVVTPQGKVYPVVRRNGRDLFLHVKNGVLPPSEEDQKIIRNCFPCFNNIKWVENK